MDASGQPGEETLWLAARLPRPLHYAHVILFAATMGKTMSAPGQSPCIGSQIDAIMTSLDLSRSRISFLYLGATLASACLQPRVGALLDRFGPQKAIFVVALCLGLTCVYMALVVHSWTSLVLGFFLLRFFGQGSIVLVSQTVINLWWVRRRGFAMGLGGSVMSLATTGLLPSLMRAGERSYGWRVVYSILGAVCLVVVLPLGTAVFRRKPEDFGLLPDARTADAAAKVEAATTKDDESEEAAFTAPEALRTAAFWATSLGCWSIAATGTAFYFHFNAVFGAAPGREAALYATASACSVAARLFGGLTLDRLAPRYVLATALACQVASMSFLVIGGADDAAYAVVALQGLSTGLMSNVSTVAHANFFGRAHIGSITGYASALVVFGSACGPFPFGLAHDLAGSFRPAFLASALVSLAIGLVVLAFMRAPPRPPRGAVELRRPRAAAYARLDVAAADDEEEEEEP